MEYYWYEITEILEFHNHHGHRWSFTTNVNNSKTLKTVLYCSSESVFPFYHKRKQNNFLSKLGCIFSSLKTIP